MERWYNDEMMNDVGVDDDDDEWWWWYDDIQVTIRDTVRLHREMIHSLQISSIRCVIGGSMGGMQALEWTLVESEWVTVYTSFYHY
jgi:homoserine O-acetyltransferase